MKVDHRRVEYLRGGGWVTSSLLLYLSPFIPGLLVLLCSLSPSTLVYTLP